jgi:hypothetical protein
MKRFGMFFGLLFIGGAAAADSRTIETKGRVQELDPLIGIVRLDTGSGSRIFQVNDDLLVRQGLTRRTYDDIKVGDLVAVRHWDDNDRADRVEILGRAPLGASKVQGPKVQSLDVGL